MTSLDVDSVETGGRRKDGSSLGTLGTSATALRLTTGTEHTAKLLIDDDPNNASLQQLGWGRHPACQWVDTDD